MEIADDIFVAKLKDKEILKKYKLSKPKLSSIKSRLKTEKDIF